MLRHIICIIVNFLLLYLLTFFCSAPYLAQPFVMLAGVLCLCASYYVRNWLLCQIYFKIIFIQFPWFVSKSSRLTQLPMGHRLTGPSLITMAWLEDGELCKVFLWWWLEAIKTLKFVMFSFQLSSAIIWLIYHSILLSSD